jgi:hypothetical protein
MFKFMSEAQKRKEPLLKAIKNGPFFPWAFLEKHAGAISNLGRGGALGKDDSRFHFLLLSQNRIYGHSLATQWHTLLRKHAKRRPEADAALRVSELVLVHDPVWKLFSGFANWQARKLVDDAALVDRIWVMKCGGRKELHVEHENFPPALRVATPASLKVLLVNENQRICWQHEVRNCSIEHWLFFFLGLHARECVLHSFY